MMSPSAAHSWSKELQAFSAAAMHRNTDSSSVAQLPRLGSTIHARSSQYDGQSKSLPSAALKQSPSACALLHIGTQFPDELPSSASGPHATPSVSAGKTIKRPLFQET